MKTNYLLSFLTLLSFLVSCNKEDKIEIQPEVVPPSTLTKLQQPRLAGNSGDKLTSIIGYGYDATGFLDTTSVRNKVIDLKSFVLLINKSHYSNSNLVYGTNFTDLLKKMSEYNSVELSGVAMSAHLKSLWKLANKTDSIDSECAFVYYSWIAASEYLRLDEINLQNFVTTNFQNDINTMSAKDLVSKYGTHILTNGLLGKKFEILYSIKSKNRLLQSSVEDCFYTRMSQFFGSVPGIIIFGLSKDNSNNEQMIYNTIGFDSDECGVIAATNNNANKILLTTASSNNTLNKTVLISSSESLPLFELINDPIRKQNLKDYIDSYKK